MKRNIYRNGLLKSVFLLAIVWGSLPTILAQTDLKKFKDAVEQDSTLIYGLAGYDATIREDILIVARHPEVVSELKSMQERSQQAFRASIEGLDRDAQFGIYELSRYPDLIKELTVKGKLSKTDIEVIILSYPEEIHQAALKYGRKHYKLLASVEHMNEKNKADFQGLIRTYDEDFQLSLKRLIDTPEVLATMADNIEFTRLAGSVYHQYPTEMELKLEVWHSQIKEQKEQELVDYQEMLDGDPEAYKEMLEAAEQFAEEEMANKKITEPVTREVEVVHINHYSYWYGYPYWYSYPYWRPYPWYYHTGFYYGSGGRVVFIGMPSYWYVGWQHYYYPNRYPHLTYHYYRHSYRHPHSYYNFNRTVNVNINNNINLNRDNLAKIDHSRGNIIPKQWPSERPVVRPGDQPIQRPTTRPSTRPAARPDTQPVRPEQRPANRPDARPATPTTRPATSPSAPTTRPASRPAPSVRYNDYRSSESFRQNWSRPATPVNRPAGGVRRR